jgi:ATP-binding cassette subfamily C protein/ATP-binding cassette subfamily C protein EexD
MSAPASDCRVCAAIRACRNGFLAVAAFSFCENLLLLASPLYMMQVYDRVLASRSGETLVYLTLIMVAALAALSLLSLARTSLLARLGQWIEQRLTPGLFERGVQSRLRGRAYGPEALGDVQGLRAFVSSPAMLALFDLPWSIIFIVACFLLHPWFGVLALVSAATLAGLAVLSEFLSKEPLSEAAQSGAQARRRLESTVRNAEVIEAMGMMPAVGGRWSQLATRSADAQSRAFGLGLVLGSATKFLRLLVQSLALCLGAYLVLKQEVSAGAMIASSILLARALGPLEQVIGGWRNLLAVRSAIQRLKAFAMEPDYRSETMAMPAPMGALAAEALVFRTSLASPLILKGVSFALLPGQSLGVIGPSGAGKSTLARLLVGAIPPTSGMVRLDGGDVFTLPRALMNQHVGYLPQDIELFTGTVAENIARLGEVQADAVVEAAKLAGVHELILRLPRGYETDIGENGQQLSGGQRQRIGLARAVYGAPRLVVLDEPNSNLDGDGELALVSAIAQLKAKGATVVIVTHRTNLVQPLDRVLMLRDGQVELFGPSQEVFGRLAGAAPARPRVVQVSAQ